MDSSGSGPAAARHEVTVSRDLDASRERVWREWTEPERFARWFCTPPFTTPPSSVEMDVRPGGRWQATQVSSEDGTELPFAGLYREVIAPERLVLTFQDPADPDDPNAEVATITLEDVEGGTRMALEQTGHLPEEQYPLLEQGYTAFFNQMAEGLSGT